MKYTTEQITEACERLGIDSKMFIKELPTKRERKVKEPEIPSIETFLSKAKEYCGKYHITYSEGLEVGIKMKYDAWLTSGWCVNVSGNLRQIKRWETTLLNTLPYIKPVFIQQSKVQNLLSVNQQVKELYG